VGKEDKRKKKRCGISEEWLARLALISEERVFIGDYL